MIDDNGMPVDDMTLAYNRTLGYELENATYTTERAWVPGYLRTIRHYLDGLGDDAADYQLSPGRLQDDGINSPYPLIDTIENIERRISNDIHDLVGQVPLKYRPGVNSVSTAMYQTMTNVLRHRGSQPER